MITIFFPLVLAFEVYFYPCRTPLSTYKGLGVRSALKFATFRLSSQALSLEIGAKDESRTRTSWVEARDATIAPPSQSGASDRS